VVAAKALGVEWEAAARDIDQALRGQFHSTDQFTGKLLGSAGFKGEAGRKRFNAMSAESASRGAKGRADAEAADAARRSAGQDVRRYMVDDPGRDPAVRGQGRSAAVQGDRG
jgi:hypothetical protein